MDETVIVIMVKDRQTGFLEKELVSCVVEKHEELILNAFAADSGDESEGGLDVVLKLTCAAEVSDEEFDLVYDNYDSGVFEGFDIVCNEVEGCFNPTWEFTFKYDEATFERKINQLLETHAKELDEVFEAIRA